MAPPVNPGRACAEPEYRLVPVPAVARLRSPRGPASACGEAKLEDISVVLLSSESVGPSLPPALAVPAGVLPAYMVNSGESFVANAGCHRGRASLRREVACYRIDDARCLRAN